MWSTNRTLQICLKTVLKVAIMKRYFFVLRIRVLYTTFVRRKSMYLRTCKSFKSVKHKKDRVPKSKIRKLQHLRKWEVRTVADLGNLFADFPLLVFTKMCPPFNESFDESYDNESGFLSCKTYIIIFYYYPYALCIQYDKKSVLFYIWTFAVGHILEIFQIYSTVDF